MRIKTERLILRSFTTADQAHFAALNSDPEVMRFYPAPYSRAQSDAIIARIQAAEASDGYSFLAAELQETGDFVGMIGVSRIAPDLAVTLPGQPKVEIGWRINTRFWGQGLTPEGARACLSDAWSRTALEEIVAYTAAINLPSQRVMEKIGMVRDVADDFEHARIASGNPLHAHVLYRIRRPA